MLGPTWFLRACPVCGGDCFEDDHDIAECLLCSRRYAIRRPGATESPAQPSNKRSGPDGHDSPEHASPALATA